MSSQQGIAAIGAHAASQEAWGPTVVLCAFRRPIGKGGRSPECWRSVKSFLALIALSKPQPTRPLYEVPGREGKERSVRGIAERGAIARRDSVTVSREPITAVGLETVSGMPSSSSLESHLCGNSHSACRGGEGRASRRYAVGAVGQSRWWLEGRDLVRLAGSWFAKFEVSEISTDLGEQLQARYIGISKGQAKGLGGG